MLLLISQCWCCRAGEQGQREPGGSPWGVDMRWGEGESGGRALQPGEHLGPYRAVCPPKSCRAWLPGGPRTRRGVCGRPGRRKRRTDLGKDVAQVWVSCGDRAAPTPPPHQPGVPGSGPSWALLTTSSLSGSSQFVPIFVLCGAGSLAGPASCVWLEFGMEQQEFAGSKASPKALHRHLGTCVSAGGGGGVRGGGLACTPGLRSGKGTPARPSRAP